MTTASILRGAAPLVAVLALALAPARAPAQSTGTVAGTVTDGDGEPISSAQVTIAGTTLGALSTWDGTFEIARVPAGTHQVRITHIGYDSASVADVTVGAGETARVDVVLTSAPVELAGVVVSASRQAERVTDAPATVTRIDADAIANTAGNSFNGALKEVKGLDYIQIGAANVVVNARGFNSSFNNRMLMIEDDRISVLPESGLPVAQFTALPKIDLNAVEVLVGPGAALYGADASNGVLLIQSKDPREHPGTTAEVTGGTRSFHDLQVRHADVRGKIGYKVAAEYQSVEDFQNTLFYGDGGIEETGVGGEVDWTSRVTRAEGAVVYYEGNSRFELTAGGSTNDGVGQTNVGRNQFTDWTYNFVQAKLSTPNWYFNVYRNQSQSGDSYAINRFTGNRAANPDLSDEEVRLMSDWPSDGRLYAAELQHDIQLDALLDTHLVWGAQYRYDRVSSDQEWLDDARTGEPIGRGQYGVYAQTETPLGDRFDVVLAARYDDHEDYDAQLSPKAAILFKPDPDQTLRLTYNRAFKSPTILQTHFWIPEFVPFVGVYGNREGYTIKNADTDETVLEIDPVVPEENQTFELGYKGVLGDRLFVDVSGYYAWYKDFLGSLLPVANPFADPPTVGYFADGTRVEAETPIGTAPEVFLTYRNIGEATVRGADAGLRYQVSPSVMLSGTFSWIDLADLQNDSGDDQATALNSTPVKWTVGADFDEIAPNLSGTATMRHVTGYEFASGINQGKVPTFDTIDLGFAYRLPGMGADLTVRANNLFTCRSRYETNDTDTACGFGEKHVEMINMPAIGTMLFVGVRYHHE